MLLSSPENSFTLPNKKLTFNFDNFIPLIIYFSIKLFFNSNPDVFFKKKWNISIIKKSYPNKIKNK